MRRTRLVGGVLLFCTMAACGSSALGPDAVPTYGPCGLQPNYLVDVRLNRWRSFPLTYFFDSASFSQDLVEEYREAISMGIRRWTNATETELAAVVQVDDRDQAQFILTFREVLPANTFARTFHSTGTPFLADGEIAFNRSYLTEFEGGVRDGTMSREIFFRGVAGVAAHEMGHLLGIIGHSSREDDLMGPRFHDAPTTGDVNTLIHAYCRP